MQRSLIMALFQSLLCIPTILPQLLRSCGARGSSVAVRPWCPHLFGCPARARGACSPWLVAASPALRARKEDPGSPALTVDGCSAGAPLSWLLSLLCNSTRCPPPCLERAVSGAVASICLIQSQVPLVPPSPCSPSSCGINCLKHFFDSRGGFCSLSPLFSIAACLELCLSGRAAALELPRWSCQLQFTQGLPPSLQVRTGAAAFQG